MSSIILNWLSPLSIKILFMLAALLPVINPPGLAPVFLSITKKNTPEQRSYLARRIAIYSFALLIGSLFFGGYVLSIFGIDMSVVRVSGGLLISITAWRLLNEAQHDHTSDTNETHQEMNKELLKQRAFYPLTFPFTVGPGAISIAITLGASTEITGQSSAAMWSINALAAGIASVLASLMVYLCYLYADRLLTYLGKTGTMVFTRLTAFILLCVGIQVLWTGIRELIKTL